MTEENKLENKAGLCPVLAQGDSCFEKSTLCRGNNYQSCQIYSAKLNQGLSRLSLITQYGSDLNGDEE